MFLGHYAAAIAAKRLTPSLSLGALFCACQLLDLIWPIFVLLGVETVSVSPGLTAVNPLDFQHYPYSHSLAASVIWSAFAGTLTYAITKKNTDALVIALLVLSHWFLDFLVHRPDLPLWPGSEKYGLGVWQSPLLTIIFEFGSLAVSLVLWRTAAKPAVFWSLIAFLAVIGLGNLFGPQPPENTADWQIAAPALAMWILVGWAYVADRK